MRTKTRNRVHVHDLRLAAMVACGLLSSAAYAHTHTVNCPDDASTFPTINAAIAASTPGANIIVCPGIYPENVNVNVDHLNIRAKIDGTAKVVPGDPSAPGFQFNADYDLVRGFAVSGFSAGFYAGDGFDHEKVEYNFIFDNGEGVSFHDSFYNKVQHNKIIGNEDNGILDVLAVFDDVKGEENIYEHNDIEYNLANGVYVNTVLPPPPPSPIHRDMVELVRAEIEKNTIDNNSLDGVLLNFSSNVKVLENDLSYNGQDGIELIASLNDTIRKNTAKWNGASMTVCGPSEGPGNCTGLRVHSTSTDNELSNNTASLNLVWDAQDNSTGAGTKGTANLWKNDTCSKDSPDGICK